MQVILEKPQEKRQHVRFPFQQPVFINRGEWESEEGSLSGDVSEGGIRLKVNEIIPVGAKLTLEIFLPDESKTTSINGRVMWVSAEPHCERYQVGIQFDLDPLNNPSKSEILRIVNPQSQPI